MAAVESQELGPEFVQLLTNLSPRSLTLQNFTKVWHHSFKDAPPPTRVNLVGTQEALSKWSFASSAANNKKGSNKKKKGKKKLQFAEHIYPVVYDPSLNDDPYDDDDEEEGCIVWLDMDMPPGTIIALLPGCDYRLSHFPLLSYGDFIDDLLPAGQYMMLGVGPGDASSGGLGGDTTVARVFFDLEENAGPLRIDKGVSLLMARVRLEWRREYYRFNTMAEVSALGQLHMVACEVTAEGANLAGDLKEEKEGWAAGVFETGTLVTLKHGAKFEATFCWFGPSTRSALVLEGTAAATLHKCLLVGTGRGDHSQHIDRFSGRGPDVLRGAHPAIAVSFASRLAIDACMISGNAGLPVQYRNALEQSGTPSHGSFADDEEAAPLEALSTAAEQEAEVERIIESRKAIRADVPATPNEREEELQKLQDEEAERLEACSRGEVTVVGGKGNDNATGRYLQERDPHMEHMDAIEAMERPLANECARFARGGGGGGGAGGGAAAAVASGGGEGASSPSPNLVAQWHSRGSRMGKLLAMQQQKWTPEGEEMAQIRSSAERLSFASTMEYLSAASPVVPDEDTESTFRNRKAALEKLTPAEAAVHTLYKSYKPPRGIFEFSHELHNHASPPDLFRLDQRRRANGNAAASDHAGWNRVYNESKNLDEGTRRALAVRCNAAHRKEAASLRRAFAALCDQSDPVGVAPPLDKRDVASAAWASLFQKGLRHRLHRVSVLGATAVTLAAKVLPPHGAGMLVAQLQCNGVVGGDGCEFSDACKCDSRGLREAARCIQVLASCGEEAIVGPLVDALVSQIGDEDATRHGRTNAANQLSHIAQRFIEVAVVAPPPPQQDAPSSSAAAAARDGTAGAVAAGGAAGAAGSDLRTTTINIITAALNGPSLRSEDRGFLLTHLQALKAREACHSVRRAFKKGLIDPQMTGDYIDFVMALGLEVDLTDSVVKDTIENPSFLTFAGERDRPDSEAYLAKKARGISEGKMKAVLAHNAQLKNGGGGGNSSTGSSFESSSSVPAAAPAQSTICANCQAVATVKKPFKKCSNCKAVHYCSGECQKAHWKAHKKLCRASGPKKES